MSHLQALTVCEPYAWMLIHGPKSIENRKWSTNYRGPLVIHSGLNKSWLKEYHRRRFSLPRSERCFELEPPLPKDTAYHFGCIIGIVDVVDCVKHEKVRGKPFAWGPYCWIMENPRPVKPVYVKGAMGLFNLDPSIVVELPKRTT